MKELKKLLLTTSLLAKTHHKITQRPQSAVNRRES